MTPLLLALTMAQAAAAAVPQPAQPAPVEIVVFSDFQCPYCALFAQPFRELQAAGVEGVRTTVTFKHFPLSIHPRAPLAHRASLAAGEQGKFWEMHDLLFANQQRIQRDDLVGYARQLGLDVARFSKTLDEERLQKVIDADLAEGERLRVSGTPTFFVNGQPYVGTKTYAQLKQLVDGEFRRARAIAEIGDDVTSRGPADAAVTIELYADLQSPVTGPATAVIDDVMRRYPGQIRLQFRNFPLAFHPQAALAHEAAMAAAREGRFWEFLRYALDHQDSLREQDLVALAGRLGMDVDRFTATMRERRYAPRVDADVRAAASKGIRGSPAIVVNGRRIDGVPNLRVLVDYVDSALTTASKPLR